MTVSLTVHSLDSVDSTDVVSSVHAYTERARNFLACPALCCEALKFVQIKFPVRLSGVSLLADFVDTVSNKGFPYVGSRVRPNSFRYLFKSFPRTVQINSEIKVIFPAAIRMLKGVFFCCNQHKIFWSIVAYVFVLMVHLLLTKERPPKLDFHDVAMLVHGPAVRRDRAPVSLNRVLPSVDSRAALLSTIEGSLAVSPPVCYIANSADNIRAAVIADKRYERSLHA